MIPYGDGVTSPNCPMSLNLDTSGDLYFSGTYESTLYAHQRQRQQGDNVVNIYRATLDSEGNFNLFQERIDGNISDNDDSSSGLVQLWSSYDRFIPPRYSKGFHMAFFFYHISSYYWDYWEEKRHSWRTPARAVKRTREAKVGTKMTHILGSFCFMSYLYIVNFLRLNAHATCPRSKMETRKPIFQVDSIWASIEKSFAAKGGYTF